VTGRNPPIASDGLARGFRALSAARGMLDRDLAGKRDVVTARAQLERMLRGFALPPSGSRIRPTSPAAGLVVTEVTPPAIVAEDAIVFMHGGGLVFHSVATFLPVLDLVAISTGRRILALEYPKAPETDPRLIFDALFAAISEIVRREARDCATPTIFGDSIGCSIVLGAAEKLLSDLLPPLVLLQPMLGPPDEKLKFAPPRSGEKFLDREHLFWFCQLLSEAMPLEEAPSRYDAGNFSRLGPITILSPMCDLLRDDAALFVAAAHSANASIQWVQLSGLPHDFALYAGKIEEARAGIGIVVEALLAARRKTRVLDKKGSIMSNIGMDSRNNEARTAHFADKLKFEIDSWDLRQATEGVVIIDARSTEAYEREHIPGAVSFPHRTMNEETTSHLQRDVLYVTYCDGIGCNASTKGALNFARLGFRVKELIGGLDWWKRDGYATEGAQSGTVSGDANCAC